MVYLFTHIDGIDIERALSLVSGQRRRKAMSYVHESDCRLSLAVYLLLAKALTEEYGITGELIFDSGVNGKPFLRDYPDIHFSLAHCPGAAICVVSGSPVGCDIERIPDKLDMDICEAACSEDEIAAILSAPSPQQAFTSLWTRKEAFLKYTGEGMTDIIKDLFPNAEKSAEFETLTTAEGACVYTVAYSNSKMSMKPVSAKTFLISSLTP